MTANILTIDEKAKLGLAIRKEMISIFHSDVVRESLFEIAKGRSAIELPSLVPDWITESVFEDMRVDENWQEEFWELEESGNVVTIQDEAFWQSDKVKRFSWNECLRNPRTVSYFLRGFLSALVSAEVASAFSSAYGELLKFKSIDIARYRKDQYLRRHADIFEDRRLAVVCFFSEGWSYGNGGELVIEGDNGSGVSVAPMRGTIALLSIQPNYFHQVMAIRSESWMRYSMASHYHSVSSHI